MCACGTTCTYPRACIVRGCYFQRFMAGGASVSRARMVLTANKLGKGCAEVCVLLCGLASYGHVVVAVVVAVVAAGAVAVHVYSGRSSRRCLGAVRVTVRMTIALLQHPTNDCTVLRCKTHVAERPVSGGRVRSRRRLAVAHAVRRPHRAAGDGECS
jgi:hypothetical protein